MFLCTLLSLGIGAFAINRYLLDFSGDKSAVQAQTEAGVDVLDTLNLILLVILVGAGLSALGSLSALVGSIRRQYGCLAFGIGLALLGCVAVVSCYILMALTLPLDRVHRNVHTYIHTYIHTLIYTQGSNALLPDNYVSLTWHFLLCIMSHVTRRTPHYMASHGITSLSCGLGWDG
jgi:hypothetical protein